MSEEDNQSHVLANHTQDTDGQQNREKKLATPSLCALIHVQEHAIVRISDGRLGYKSHSGRQHYITFAHGERSLRAYDERVEIVVDSDEVAQKYLTLLAHTELWYKHLREDPAPRTESWIRDKWKLLAFAETALDIPEAEQAASTARLREDEKRT